MGYWNEVRDMVVKGMNIAVDGIKEGAEVAAEKGKEGVTYVQIKKDLYVEHRKLLALLSDLGDKTNDLYQEKKDIYKDEYIKDLMEKVVAAEAKCKSLKEELEKVGQREAPEVKEGEIVEEEKEKE